MKKWIKVVLAALLAVLTVSSPVLAEDVLSEIVKRGTLRVGMEAGYIPFEMKDKSGSLTGFDVDMMTAAAKAMGVKVEFINTEWDGIIPALLTGKFDIIASGMTVTQERNLRVNFAEPYITIGQTLLIHNSLKGKIKSYADLNSPKFTVTSKLGTTGEQAVKRLLSKAKYLSFQTEQEAVLEVINGRAQAFVYDLPFNVSMAASKGKGKVTHLDTPFTFEPLAWAVRRDDYNFINWLNNFLNQVKNDGTYEGLYDKWFRKDDWLKNIQE
ncbi:MAG: transporter substrate-binding domain-containing protein [Deltaproteobacteria bacterium]|nr:transporter substrate-binding domain-containing protein [Deltaproteobacteria bacterium]